MLSTRCKKDVPYKKNQRRNSDSWKFALSVVTWSNKIYNLFLQMFVTSLDCQSLYQIDQINYVAHSPSGKTNVG